MSESVLVALIGLAGSVITGLLGAFGSIAVVEMKGEAQNRNPGCGLIGLITVSSAVLGLILGLFLAPQVITLLKLEDSSSYVQPTSVPETPSRNQSVTIYLLGDPPAAAVADLTNKVSDNGRLEVKKIFVDPGDEIECLGECHYTHCDVPNEKGYYDYYVTVDNGRHIIPSYAQNCIIVPWGR
jgi:hypothetical protein